MKKKTSKLLIYIILFTAGFTIALLYGNYKLEKQRILMQSEIDKSERKAEQLQRRYVEQKATADRLQRMNVSLNGQKNTLKMELDRAKEEYADLENDFKKMETLKNENSNKLAECEKSYNSLLTENNRLQDRLEEEKTILTETKKEHEEQVEKLEKDRDDRIAELRSLENRMKSCTKKNARLCIIAEELLNRYENKGIMSTLLEKEPMTQIKKVELDTLTREYKENIEKQRERIRDQ
ncbi:MAG: hypothetical protein PVG39_23010 [Desulfobacteraceae bacterium]|jgi:chromosome segregation ATPase